MSDFTYTPSYSSQRKYAPRVLAAKFGDGYEQRVADGINTNPEVWDTVFQNRSDTDANAIEAFFVLKAGVTAFTWTPPVGSEITVVCRQWQRTFADAGANTVSASFERVFE